MRVGCVVLAAGKGQRFGASKLHAQLFGQSLISRALDAVPEKLPACVVTGDIEIAALAEARGFTAVRNNRPEEGISRSIRLGIMAMEDFDGLCFLVADQPFLRKESVAHLLSIWHKTPDAIVRAVRKGIPGNPCGFPKRLFPSLCALQADLGGSVLIRTYGAIPVELPECELLDCDTQEMLRAFQEKEDAPCAIPAL